MKHLFFALLGILFISLSCTKEEGIGGQSALIGKVVRVEYITSETNKDSMIIKREVPASDQEVYIIYGNNTTIGDKITTSNDGSFKFEYLQAGKYKIVTYSEDTANVNTLKMSIVKEITISDGNISDIGTLKTYKKINIDEGNSTIKGKVICKEYTQILPFGSLAIKGQMPASKEDVFIMYGNSNSVFDKVTTSNDGSFEFKNMQAGKYKILVYSEDTLNTDNKKMSIVKEFTITDDTTFNVGIMNTYKKLNYDKGTSIIMGKVVLIDYAVDSSLITKKDSLVIQREIPAINEDVYIINGDETVYSDKVSASFDGSFEFKSLRAGKYKIVTYSDDTLNIQSKMTVLKEITIDDNKLTDIGTLKTYNKLDVDEGNGSISGKIILNDWAKNFTSIQETKPAQEIDVYLKYGNHKAFDLRVRTSSDGTFIFPNLVKGKYTFIVYTAEKIGTFFVGATYKTPIEVKAAISKENEHVGLANITIDSE